MVTLKIETRYSDSSHDESVVVAGAGVVGGVSEDVLGINGGLLLDEIVVWQLKSVSIGADIVSPQFSPSCDS